MRAKVKAEKLMFFREASDAYISDASPGVRCFGKEIRKQFLLLSDALETV